MNDEQTQQAVVSTEPQAQAPATEQVNGGENTAPQAPATITGNAGTPQVQNPPTAQEPAQAEPVVYDLKGSVPEGWEFDQTANDAFLAVIKDTGLSNEQANAISAYGYQWAQSMLDAAETARNEQITSWGNDTKKELGAKFDATVALCGTAVEYLEKANPGLRAALNETGAGNRIEIVRAFATLGELLQSDPGKLAGAGVVKGNAASSRYPNTDFSRYK